MMGAGVDGIVDRTGCAAFGLRASAIRYYESEGLIPKAARKSGRRVYDADILDHLLFVRLALGAGFRIGEIKPMVYGMTVASKPGERWRGVAERKLLELDQEITSLQSKKRLLQNLVKCQCASLAHFAKAQTSKPA